MKQRVKRALTVFNAIYLLRFLCSGSAPTRRIWIRNIFIASREDIVREEIWGMGRGMGIELTGDRENGILLRVFPLDGSTNYNPLKCSWVWLPVTIKWDKLGWSRHYKRGLAAPGASGATFRPMAKKGSNLPKRAIFCIRMTQNWENDRGGKSERQIALALRTLSKCVKVERVISTSAFGKNGKRKEHTP